MWHVLGRGDAYKVVVGTPEGKRPLGRLKCRQEGNIKMVHQEMGWKRVDWIDVAQDWDKWWALLNKVMKLGVALNVENFLNSFDTIRFPKWTLLCQVLFIYLVS
jgi:hypothetical protein